MSLSLRLNPVTYPWRHLCLSLYLHLYRYLLLHLYLYRSLLLHLHLHSLLLLPLYLYLCLYLLRAMPGQRMGVWKEVVGVAAQP